MHKADRILLLIVALLLLPVAISLGDTLLEERLARWQEISLDHSQRTDRIATDPEKSRLFRGGVADFGDLKICEDTSAASFTQRLADLAVFSDGKILVVWEDQRNGDWDIYVQLYNADGAAQGANFELISDPDLYSQRQPRIAIDKVDHAIIVWAEEESAGIYSSVYDGLLSPLTERTRLDDAPGGNAANLPAVASLESGGFAVVWEDTRAGANIYGQLVTTAGTLSGANFQVNESGAAAFRLVPAVVANGLGSFAVAWEDARDGETDVYLKILSGTGTPVTGDIKVADAAYESAYQFNAQLGYADPVGYVVGWISNRHGGQGVYAQLVSTGGALIDTNFQMNESSDDVCWDLRIKPSGSGAACTWADLSSTAAIVYQVIGSDGSLSGSNREAHDQTASGERSAPSIALSGSGGRLAWTDRRNGNRDIYTQILDGSFDPDGSNQLVNDDLQGSQQLAPDVVGLHFGWATVVWQDQRDDEGDIYLQMISYDGNLIDSPRRLNDDLFAATQANPRIAATEITGEMIAVWEDRRNDGGTAGQNIFAQRIGADGNPSGANFLVNDDGSTQPKSEPDVAMAANGSFAAAWVDERDGAKNIYAQVFGTITQRIDNNQLVSKIPEASESYASRLSMRTDGSFVVSWISVIGQRRTAWFQRFSASGVMLGENTPLAIDTSDVDVLQADLFVHPTKGDFYLAFVDSLLTGSHLKLQRYLSDGQFTGIETIVSEAANLGFADLRLTGDVSDELLVTWTDRRSGSRRAYMQLVREDGFKLGNNWPLSANSDPVIEACPTAAMSGGYYTLSWIDNRNPDCGFDLFAAAEVYTSTAVDNDETILPETFGLEQNYPNPFNPTTVISYSLAAPARVRLEVFDLLGRKVVRLVEQYQPDGNYRIEWDGRDRYGSPVASGVYLYRLQAGGLSATRKMTLLK